MKQGTIVFPSVDLKDDRKLILAVDVTDITAQFVEELTDGSVKVPPTNVFALRFGHSIKNPKDSQNEKLGAVIATGRAKKTPVFGAILQSKGVSKIFLTNLAKVLQDEFGHRLENYITTSKKGQLRKTEVQPD